MSGIAHHTSAVFGASESLQDRVASIRNDFPILDSTVNGYPLAYLDNAATAQKPTPVIESIARFYCEQNANVHRGVHELSQGATESFERARTRVQTFIGANEPSEIVFTRGTTESINLVAYSFLRHKLVPGSEVLVSGMEHHSNIVPWQLICEESGAALRVIPVDDRGELDYTAFQRLLSERTRLVALAHVSNTLGTINPVRRMISDAHGLGIPVLLDGAQAVPHQRVDVQELGCDFYCFSAHKMYGPTGIGILFSRRELLEAMPPWQGGGDMIESVSFEKTTYNEIPHRFEAGTPNIAGAIGLEAAIEYIETTGFDFISKQETDLLEYAVEQLSEISDVRQIGLAADRVGVLSFLVGESHPYDVGTVLDRFGVAVRTGHHCTQPLMERFGIPGTVRASFSFYNTREEVDRLAAAVEKAHHLLCR
jgi:cysteine desulfurase / selenocysteine lyase